MNFSKFSIPKETLTEKVSKLAVTANNIGGIDLLSALLENSSKRRPIQNNKILEIHCPQSKRKRTMKCPNSNPNSGKSMCKEAVHTDNINRNRTFGNKI